MRLQLSEAASWHDLAIWRSAATAKIVQLWRRRRERRAESEMWRRRWRQSGVAQSENRKCWLRTALRIANENLKAK